MACCKGREEEELRGSKGWTTLGSGADEATRNVRRWHNIGVSVEEAVLGMACSGTSSEGRTIEEEEEEEEDAEAEEE